MNLRLLVFLSSSIMLATSCNNAPGSGKSGAESSFAPGTFGYDVHFLQTHDSIIVLRNGEAKVLVSPKYQGKVFSSTAGGDDGPSFGWIHYKAFEGPPDTHMNAYGGENRLWLGPEGGKYSLFFPPGAKMEFANWKTPAAFDTEPWTVVKKDEQAVHLAKQMTLTNYAGTTLSIGIDRTVTILSPLTIYEALSLSGDMTFSVVGYRTTNILTNTGDKAWTETTGMPCLWLLDMFNPSAATTIVIPFGGTRPNLRRPTILRRSPMTG